jgi:hypothetical protein
MDVSASRGSASIPGCQSAEDQCVVDLEGMVKPLALAGVAATAAAGFLHWITVGPNGESGQRLRRGARCIPRMDSDDIPQGNRCSLLHGEPDQPLDLRLLRALGAVRLSIFHPMLFFLSQLFGAGVDAQAHP